jgi:hypothetical protein
MRFTGWNFCGDVWWDGSNFHCLVWVQGIAREKFTKPTLDEIMNAVCSKFGH